jgi:hypothetical protein
MVNLSLRNFNGGELGKTLAGRTDLDIYHRGCKVMKNMLPEVQGMASRRLGTRYINATHNSATSRLIDFRFSESDSYALEFGEYVIRLYTLQNQVRISATPYEIITPYSLSEIAAINYRQIGDVVYLVHPNHKQRKLIRSGATDWALTEVENLFGATIDRDVDELVTMTATGSTTTGATVTITASSSGFGTDKLGFQNGHIGSVWAFGEASDSLSPYSLWEAGASSSANAYYRYEERLFQAATNGTFGTIPPTHESGTVNDGNIDLTFINMHIGYAKMLTLVSDVEATFKIQLNLPPTIQSGSSSFEATTYWNEASWSSVRGFPRAMCFHEERVFYAGTYKDPITIWGSRSNRRFEDFNPSIAEDDASLTYELAGELNTIRWLHSDNNFILAATAAGLAFLGSGSSDAPLTPSSVKARSGAGFGSSAVEPISVYNTIQYILRQGTRINKSRYEELNLTYLGEEISLNNPDILKAGVKEWTLVEEPNVIIWIVTNDGELISFSEEISQKVFAFARHEIVGATVESVTAIPASKNDEVWLVVNRNGSRSIEMIEPNNKNYLVDSGVVAALKRTIPNLGHLEGLEVTAWHDGDISFHTVSGGSITLDATYNNIYVGMNYESDISPMYIDWQLQQGSAQTIKKSINEISIRHSESGTFKCGRSFDKLFVVKFQDGATDPADVYALHAIDYPEDVTFTFDSDNSYGNIAIRQDLPLPLNILSINPRAKADIK